MPVHSCLKDIQIVFDRKDGSRQGVPLLSCPHNEGGSKSLRANERNIDNIRMKALAAPRRSEAEKGRGDQVMQHVLVFTEMQPVKHREACHSPAVLKGLMISFYQYVVTDESFRTVLNLS